MKGSIRNLFGLNKKSKKSNNIALNEVYSPNSSVSSFSSNSSTHESAPPTPTNGIMQENRGIFRTLEPVWYFQSSLLRPNTNEWVPFDDQIQYLLETSSNTKSECKLEQSPLGPCTISFITKKKERQSMMNAKPLNTNRVFELNKQIRRIISPIWWFEQDSMDGSKGMCRFDSKNQVRLEALSDGRTRLVLTDDAFNVPITVVLDAPKQPELREEVRGFLYFEPISSAFQLAYHATFENKLDQYIQQQELDDQWTTTLTRRCSV